ncbi:hypothetical protein O181_101431 [Austropuccinia psidii MF-1]|uniref:Uncharacterized protein n=1 Tax=Austropuccinia psidii MF-1 TaxID=1389203 RepID=A0A9Q3JGP8_9BASI|nr:hypothetical protein [Austropuccinia psidii MF-1]
MAMARGHSNFGQLSPCLVTDGIQIPKTKPRNPPQQDSPVPSLPHKQLPWQPTPGPSGTQWSEELFHAHLTTPRSIIITYDMPVVSPLPRDPFQCPKNPNASSPPVQSPSHSHNNTRQEFTDLQPTLMIPQAIIHKSINQIFLEHRCLLHMIPFVDATRQNETHRESREELNSLLAQALESYPKEDIPRIVSKILEK